ncbi:MAG: hypothetical protein L6R42_007948 [Xanthoria sp. 1 TBL-2021]|nr:MAG: hypothetical protein L6R42_007948 [Xanthoria sp. 1 TBL-2021]
MIVSMRRKALIPYTFQDGLHIPEGSWVCVASRAMMLDPKYYQDPMSFDGYRFLGKQGQQDTPDSPPSSPGRYYASHVLKLALRNILRHYDIKPADAAAKRTFAWRTAIIPRENVHLLFRHRTEKKPI